MAATETKRGKEAPNSDAWREFPWWLLAIIAFLVLMAIVIMTQPDFNRAFMFIKGNPGTLEGGFWVFIGQGLTMTITITLVAFAFALMIGLLAALGRISRGIVPRNLAIFYIEFIRGVPTLVLIFTVSFVLVPWTADLLRLQAGNIGMPVRAIIALAVIYGAFLAEIFRAGIESISRGQMEAARSLGMSGAQAMRYIILPQAIRNILPALGNDFIAMLKDSSLVSVLAVREITQMARLYAGSTFRFRESYLVLTFLYLAMTLALSLLLRLLERRLGKNV